MRPPKTGLARRWVRRLPVPIGSAKLLACLNKACQIRSRTPSPTQRWKVR